MVFEFRSDIDDDPDVPREHHDYGAEAMTGIGGPGGVGPKGPIEMGGVDGAEGAAGAQGAAELSGGEAAHASAAQRTGAAAGLQGMDALAGEIAAGRLTPKQAIDYLVDAAGAELAPEDQVELRELLGDLFANDPHLRGLIDQLGGQP
jgi:hypothetical protein